MNVPDHAQVAQWLQRAGIDFYQCDECHGLHLAQVQEEEAVSNAGLYVEPHSIVLSIEVVVRPMGLLPLVADLGRLSMDYPLLKLFQDTADDSMPQLIIGATQLTGAGLSFEQFQLFLRAGLDASRQLIAECSHLDYLYRVDSMGEQLPHAPVH